MTETAVTGVALLGIWYLALCAWLLSLLAERDMVSGDRDFWRERAKKEAEAEKATFEQLCIERREWVAELAKLARRAK